MKKRTVIARIFGFAALAAGVSIAVLASREEGREKLAGFGDIVGKSAEAIGTIVSNGSQLAGQWIESMQQQGAEYPTQGRYPTPASYSYPQNGTTQHQGEYTQVR